jgi:hypothetical protein
MRTKIILALVGIALIALGVGAVALQARTPDATLQDIERLNNQESMLLLDCQIQKMAADQGKKATKQFLDEKVTEVIQDENAKNIKPLQYDLLQEGYWCDPAKLVRQQKKAEKQALWGPPVSTQNAHPGLFGGAFNDEIKYKVQDKTTGYWMDISNNKELQVTTNADSEAEVAELADTLKEEESGGFDFTRVGYYGGKGEYAQDKYYPGGAIVIISSKDGLTMFGDQYPLGNAYEQAEKDFAEGDGIIFIAGEE